MHLSLKMLGKRGREQPVLSVPAEVIRGLPCNFASGFSSLKRGILLKQDLAGQVLSMQGSFFVEDGWECLRLLLHLWHLASCFSLSFPS